MNITQLKDILKKHPDKKVRFALPDQTVIPPHFHITEVGHVQKDFIDCGGTRRSSSACVLQAWVAEDEDHSLGAGKLGDILKLADKILPSGELEVEVEFEAPVISQFPVVSVENTREALVFRLASKHTDCLAKEKCGVESSCCSTESDCCS